MNRQSQWTVNITGDEWQVLYVPALEGIYARKEGRELMNSLGLSGSDELFYRACIACRSIMQDGRPVFDSGAEVLKTLTEREIFSITDENVRNTGEEAAESPVEKREAAGTDGQKSKPGRFKTEYEPVSEKMKSEGRAQWTQWAGASERMHSRDGVPAAGTYRDSVDTLSRYLERDSRRFDG